MYGDCTTHVGCSLVANLQWEVGGIKEDEVVIRS